ncbi:HAD family phosphatase [Paenibacillus sp. J22TS3]|uniref:HAD family hydrolase n=1 Tax=Paenibacillus sp. J22TS3 TaxID=2807192 RepID=UPI001B19C1B8|nr:HAD family hydrolase [Paenibacillus sp. J22TS3]GIP21919.1 phosphatase [Paenibacillus sp. J22TS3]
MKAFIFDMDGVIIDSEPIHFEVEIGTVKYFGAEITQQQLENYVGMTAPEMWNEIRNEYKLAHPVEEILAYQLENKIKALRASELEPIEGIKEVIEGLKQRQIPVGIASSSSPEFIKEVLLKFGLTEYFDCIVSGEEVPKGKPAPDVYLKAAEQLGVKPEDCVVLEDSSHGVTAAKAAGMRCIGYVNVNSGNQDLSRADLIVSSIHDINLDDLSRL